MSSAPQDDEYRYTINLRDDQGHLWPARVSLETHWPERLTFHPDECEVTFAWAGGELHGSGYDYFDAFLAVRAQLTERHLMPICYGVSRRIIVSGLIRDMGQGMIAYKILPDNTVNTKHVVNIFETGDDVEPVSLEEQRQFQQDWLASKSK